MWSDIILKLSQSKIYDEALNEFVFIKKEDRDSFDDGPPCACGRKIKCAFYYANRITGKHLCAGSSCSGKFTREVKRKVNRLYGNVIRELGIFVKVLEPEYSESVKNALVHLIRSEMRTGNLHRLREEVHELIADYNHFDYLTSILAEVDDMIQRRAALLQRVPIEKERPQPRNLTPAPIKAFFHPVEDPLEDIKEFREKLAQMSSRLKA
jgi:hypothetical protein